MSDDVHSVNTPVSIGDIKPIDDPMLQLLPPVHRHTRIDPLTKRFLPGNAPGPGRPKGIIKAEKVYLKAAPRLAKAYVKQALKGNAALLKDSREWIMPVDTDAAAQSSARVLIFVGPDGLLPRSSDPPPLVSEGQTIIEISPTQIQSTEGQ